MRYHERARRAIALLFRAYNDIDVYVEDSSAHNLWAILIDRMLEGRAKVSKVFQLGGKDQVINACAEDQDDDARRRLYIIDGDFGIALGAPKPELKHLYRLECYNVECLLFTETAVVEVAVEQMTNSPRLAVAELLDFAGLSRSIVSPLAYLFACYAAAHAVEPSCQTVGYKVERLCVDNGSDVLPTDEKVGGRIVDVREAVVAAGKEGHFEATLESVKVRLAGSTEHTARFICGKTHLIPLVFHRMKRRAGFKGTAEQFKVRLARHTSLDVDPGLCKAIRQAAS